MKHISALIMLLVALPALASAVRSSAWTTGAGVAGLSTLDAVQPSQDRGMYDDGYGTESDGRKSSSGYDSYQYNARGDRAYYSSEKRVITLEMLKQDTADGQPSPRVEQSTNSTGMLLGLVCSQKTAYGYYNGAEANPYGEDDEDTGPLIQGNPTPLEQIGKGRADIKWAADQKRVDIGKQKGLLVATISGEFNNFEDGAECNPLLTRRAKITFNNVPVYAMITQSALPLDPSMLKRLVPFASGATPDPQPPNPNMTLPSIPGLLPLPTLPGGADGDVSSTISQTAGNGAIRTGTLRPAPQAAAAKVAVASALPANTDYYDDQTLCGLTLVAKGPATLRTQGETYAGSVESALLWTNGVVSLGGVTADAVAASSGQSTQSLFSTTVNQVLTSTTYNGISSAQLVSVVGNSASTTVVNSTSSGTTVGGNVNVTQDDNVASSNSDNATLVAGDSVSNNRVNVLNVVGGGIEQYLKLLKTMCKHHKEVPESRPGTIRFDLLPVRVPTEGEQQQEEADRVV